MSTNGQFGSIRKLPSGRFQVRYFHLGRRITGDTTFPSKGDARAFLAGVETDIRRGNFFDPSAGRITFGEYSALWLEQRPIRPHTRATYTSQLTHLLPTFGAAQLSEITPVDVRRWHGRLFQSGLHLNSVSKIYRLFRTILTTAVDDGLLAKNPARIRGASKEQMIERPLLDGDQVVALANAILPRCNALVWTAAASGLRFGELAGLTLRHFDIERSELCVEQALTYTKGQGTTLGPPKTDSAHRTVVVPIQITARLCLHIEDHLDHPGSSDLLFTSARGSPLLNRTFAPWWRRAVEEVGPPGTRFHDLRHLAGHRGSDYRGFSAGGDGPDGSRHEQRIAAVLEGFRDPRPRHLRRHRSEDAPAMSGPDDTPDDGDRHQYPFVLQSDTDDEPFDIDLLEEVDPFEIDRQVAHLFKHDGIGVDDIYEIWNSDPLFYRADPPAHWIMVADIAGQVLMVPLAPSDHDDVTKCRPIGCYVAAKYVTDRYWENR